MPSPRWRKVLRDLWRNKGRTLLVVISIAVGVFAVGTVIHMQVIVRQDMIGSYNGASPANATIYVEGEFDDDLVQAVRDMPEVAEAEGRRSVLVRFQLDPESGWYPMILFAIPDYENMKINVLQLEKEFGPAPSAWPGPVPLPPPENEVMIERTSCIIDRNGLIKAQLGDVALFETPMGKQREMRLSGLVADFSRLPATNYLAYGYVTFDTLEWLGLPRTYSEMVILVNGDRTDKAHIEQVGKKVADRMERGGVTVLRTQVPEPGQLPLDYMVDGLVYILGALGVLSLFSSVFLLINTVQALLSQQVRQIGVMKALGARNHQIMGMYLSMIVIFGVLALTIAIPLGTWIARWIVNFMTYFINFNLSSFGFPPQVLAVEVAMGLLVPLLAGLWPIIAGTRITIREAISSYGLGEGGFGSSFIDRLIEQVRGLPRPVLLSLRNT
ncbi:MAG: ABC transporter permease, partial [Anaerolineae bacterium]|nr:ABC transporter permease [Anaerolineae bacterium]